MNKKNNKNPTSPSEAIFDQPITPIELVNKYGTYNIQPTADAGNEFPAIAQGIPKDEGDLAKRE